MSVCCQVSREGSAGWCGAMRQVAEDTDDDIEEPYISSDESAHGADLAELFRVKPSPDIWELGNCELPLCVG